MNDVYELADVGINDLRFSLAEALYARGFTSVQSVSALTLVDFQDALTGTVAYDPFYSSYVQFFSIRVRTTDATSPLANPPRRLALRRPPELTLTYDYRSGLAWAG
jgi:hypothetical protein